MTDKPIKYKLRAGEQFIVLLLLSEITGTVSCNSLYSIGNSATSWATISSSRSFKSHKFDIRFVEAKCPVHLILINLIIVVTFGAERKLWTCSLCKCSHSNFLMSRKHNWHAYFFHGGCANGKGFP